ncbi:MAG TPA: VIT and VWA domain-containing protein [Terracidiphilus sp.]|nr:VIT and VWA domain-containing protein [Terracidiphilus sp.]
MRRASWALWLLLWMPLAAHADSGVLIPTDKQAPDPAILSLTEMQVDIHIDNGDARVWVRQVFTNHTNRPQEGNYQFALPGGTTVSDFAVWDGPVRIPAVILERKRAKAIYQELKSQAIDPGLLEQGERTADEARRSAIFSAHIVPIPAYGTKRLEIEYHERIPVSARKSYFLLPLKPDSYASQKTARLTIHFELRSAARLKDFAFQGRLLPFHIEQQDEHVIRGTVDAANIELAEDFSTVWAQNETQNAVEVITYRDPNPVSSLSMELASSELAVPTQAPQKGKQKQPQQQPNTPVEPGFFEALAQLSTPPAAGTAGGQGGRTVVVLMDTSLSMQWEKLERSYAAAAKLLETLGPEDKFNLLLFNTRVDSFKPAPVQADLTSTKAAMDWLRQSHLRGGTDLQKALQEGLNQFSGADASQTTALVLLTDGEVTRGLIQSGKLADWYAAKWRQIPAERRPKTEVFAVGDDANLPLLRMLSRNGGVMEQVLSTEPVDYKLAAFLGKVGRTPIGDLRLTVAPEAAVNKVYSLEEAVFDGGEARWVGQYTRPQKGVSFSVSGNQDGRGLKAETKAELPAKELEHDQLPRLWAGARVQALLEQIEREGETEAAINEIIMLARRYKFVTPYTSFLAAPRSLLRPRVIRPGDPVLRVHTDKAIVSVIALFPFGLEKPLRYLAGEDVWQTRFLAPTDMKDGIYQVRLVLRDTSGQVYREQKSFVIASTPPTVKLRLDKTRFRAGEMIPLKVSASESTRTLTARLEGLAPVSLHWNREAGASTGQLWLPQALTPGEYVLAVTAEDMAHNLGSAEVHIEVVP